MKHSLAVVGLGVLLFTTATFAADRKVRTHVKPAFPEIAKKMHLTGVVRMQVQVAADGSVTSATVVGGHPVLAKAAVEAVQKWKYEPGSPDSVTVNVDFTTEAE